MNTTAEKTTDAGVLDWPMVRPIRPAPSMREETIAARLTTMQEAGIKLPRIAVECGVSREALEAWIKGERAAETTAALSSWLEGIDRDIAERDGEFVMTPLAGRILRAFEQARAPKGKDGRRGIALIYGARAC